MFDGSESTETGIIIITLAFVGLVYLLPSIATTWQLFSKAGQYGWSAIIPLYSTYVFGVIAKRPMWLIAAFIGLEIISNYIAILGFPYFVLALYFLAGFIKQYSAGLLFWIMYIFIPWVALFMVNKVQYIGDPSQPAQSGPATPETTAAAPNAQPVTAAQPQQPPVGFAPQSIEAQQFTPVQTPVQPTPPVAPTAEQAPQEPPTNPPA